MTDTPRTDAAMWGGYDGPVVVDADFARQLERELAEARRTINEITGPLVLCGEAEMRDVEGFREKIITMREAMVGYRQELAEARRDAERLDARMIRFGDTVYADVDLRAAIDEAMKEK